jgi:hypothetical protein
MKDESEAGGNASLRRRAERGSLKLSQGAMSAESGRLADEADQSALVGHKVSL